MKVIALWGRESVGKSTTLKRFLLRLLSRYNLSATNLEDNSFFTRDVLEREIANENENLLSKNCKVRDYIVKIEIDGVKYGITTHGDNEWFLRNGFDALKDCDVVFCATRTKRATVEFVKKHSEKLIWVAKTYVSGDREILKDELDIVNYTNEQQVEVLFRIFEELNQRRK